MMHNIHPGHSTLGMFMTQFEQKRIQWYHFWVKSCIPESRDYREVIQKRKYFESLKIS